MPISRKKVFFFIRKVCLKHFGFYHQIFLKDLNLGGFILGAQMQNS